MAKVMVYHSHNYFRLYKIISANKSKRNSPVSLKEANCYAINCLWRGHCEGNCWWPPGAEGLSSNSYKKLNSANNYVSLEEHSKLQIETPAVAYADDPRFMMV